MTTEQSLHPLVDRATQPDGTRVRLGPVEIGSHDFAVIAGPCAVEGAAELDQAARMVVAAGVPLLRGGAFKPRTSPYSFQGLGKRALLMLHECRRNLALPVVTEVMAASDIRFVERHADMLQVGARNMHNTSLLKALGKARKPVLLKRGLAATVEEWLCAAEYIVKAGNPSVVLCERGIRTFEPSTRNTLDLNSVALLKRLTHLPVLVDPSHGTGRRDLVRSMACAALAAGADGLMIEAHPHPEQALSDGQQSLDGEALGALMNDLARLAPVYGRHLPIPDAQAAGAKAVVYRQRVDALDQSLTLLLRERVRLGKLLDKSGGTDEHTTRNERWGDDVLPQAALGGATGELSSAALKRMFRQVIEENNKADKCDAA